jgi:hypothetical protein
MSKYEFIMRVVPLALASFLMGIMVGEKILYRSIMKWVKGLTPTSEGKIDTKEEDK